MDGERVDDEDNALMAAWVAGDSHAFDLLYGRCKGPLYRYLMHHLRHRAQADELFQDVWQRVIAARALQQHRFTGRKVTCNARMGSRELKEFCTISDSTLDLLKMAIQENNLSARAYDRILKVARTIADLAASPRIATEHIAEAIQFRSLDRQLWS